MIGKGKRGDRITTWSRTPIPNHIKEIILSWADSGNRTRIFSLAKRNFTIRPYPHFSFLIHNMSTQYYKYIPRSFLCSARPKTLLGSIPIIFEIINWIFSISLEEEEVWPPSNFLFSLFAFSIFFWGLLVNFNMFHNREKFGGSFRFWIWDE